MTALSLALALWGLLAFAGWWMWLQAQHRKAPPIVEERLVAVERKASDVVNATLGFRGELDRHEDRRRKLSKRVGDLEFRHLGKRMTPPEDEA